MEGADPWLNKQLETDEELKKEITNKDIIKEVLLPPIHIFISLPSFAMCQSLLLFHARCRVSTVQSHKELIW